MSLLRWCCLSLLSVCAVQLLHVSANSQEVSRPEIVGGEATKPSSAKAGREAPVIPTDKTFYKASCRPKSSDTLVFIDDNFRYKLCNYGPDIGAKADFFTTLFKELRKQKESTGKCWKLTDPQFYHQVKCHQMKVEGKLVYYKPLGHYIMHSRGWSMLEMILEHGFIDPNVKNPEGKTMLADMNDVIQSSLHRECKQNDPESLEYCASIKRFYEQGTSILLRYGAK